MHTLKNRNDIQETNKILSTILFFSNNYHLANKINTTLQKNNYGSLLIITDEDTMLPLLKSPYIKIIDYQYKSKWVDINSPLINANKSSTLLFSEKEINNHNLNVQQFTRTHIINHRLLTILNKKSNLNQHRTYTQSLDYENLTKSEKVVFTMICSGKTNQEISQELCRSIHTVKTHIYNCYRKLNVSNRIQAINKMHEMSDEFTN